jgi:voltage-gated potassium channel
MSSQRTENQFAGPYELFMLGLCLFALISMAIDTFLYIDSGSKAVLEWSDTGVCIIFFFDFLTSLWRAENRWRYFITWGWIDLLSSIPSVDLLRLGRAARILRVFRLMRGVRATRLLTSFILRKRTESAFLAATLISILIITFSSIAVLQLEVSSDSNIKTPGDAIWWSLVTLTTVGYGDRFPVTTEGRVIGAFLMVTGVGLFGMMSGFIASWFLSPMHKKEESEIEILRREISELRSTILESREKVVAQEVGNVTESEYNKVETG